MNVDPTVDSYPLSPTQQGMLFHSLSARQPGVDIEQVLCALHEDLDVAALEAAWQRIAARHAVLRSAFRWERLAAPRQEVQRQARIAIRQQDWRDVPAAERQELLETWLQTDRLAGFDLTQAPLMRLALFRVGEADYQLVWTFHHLLLDARSIGLVCHEVFAFYDALSRGEELEMPAPPPYGDYIAWLQQQDLSGAESFWRRTLKGFAAPTSLLTGHAPIVETGGRAVGEQEIRLTEPLTATLRALAERNGFTLNTVLQGMWALLLSRYSGEEDVVFGAVRACRHSSIKEAPSTVGLFINTVPLRVNVDRNVPLLAWLAELRKSWVALRPFEHTPLVKIQSWSELPGDTPLFDTIYSFQDPSWDAALCAQGGRWDRCEFAIRSQPNYPLAVDASGDKALRIKIVYHRNRWDDAAITRMLGHLKSLLEAVAGNPGQRLSQLPMLTDRERQQVLVEWNDTAAEFPRNKCIHELFEEQVSRTPQALAVSDGKTQWTYAELNERADTLARRLRNLNVRQPETLVGVCLERSADMVACLLAVWKAGGAHVPFDPSYPKQRLEFMLRDTGAPVLLTQESVRARLNFGIPNLQVLCVDAPDASREARAPNVCSAEAHSRNLAYVIYTSGSTGNPKGVEIEHASLANLIAWHQRVYEVTPGDRATQLAAPAFDASIWELWPYLTAGASIHIPDEETRHSPAKLREWLVANGITISFVPTPLAEAMLDEPWPANSKLRALLTGGDKLHRPPPKSFPGTFVNHYGPTENTVVTTWTAVPPEYPTGVAPPIGRPIANTRVYVLDRHLDPVPIGVPGELCISGAGLARGYLNRPELSAEKFVANPFSNDPPSRLYRSGDLVRWLPDGNIEFLGRNDHQIKVRGHRIEPGEIEVALRSHPGIREALAMARDDSGEIRLVAYVVPANGAVPATNDLREFLKQKLPECMLPASFMFLPSLPLTPNGKVNRTALPAAHARTEAEFISPCTPLEETLAGIWRDVLGVGCVGVGDNFFHLGGHSILATQMMSRVREALDVEIPLRDLFDTPTVAGLAQRISRARHGSLAQQTGPPPEGGRATNGHFLRAHSITRRPRNGSSPLSFAQERLWFLEQLQPGAALNNIPVAFRLTGALNAAALERALDQIIARHEPLRTVFTSHNGRPTAVIEPVRPFMMPVTDLTSLSRTERETETQRLVAEEAQRPFDLMRSPLVRAKLLRLAPDKHVLLLITHHLVCDGWSLGVFHRELSALYDAAVRGCSASLAEFPIDYADFAQWQREVLQGRDREGHLDYWMHQLKDAPLALNLPTDRPRPAVQSCRGATQCLALPSKLSAELSQFCRNEGVTSFMLLLAAFQTLLHRYCGQDDILVGSPLAGRTRLETEHLIGHFLNTLVFRGDLSGDPPFRELLKRVRQTALEAYAHQDLPFEKLVDALQSERDLSRSPLFQVMFILQNEPLKPLELSGLKVEPLPIHSATAKFDLLLSMEETADGLGGFVEYSTDLFDGSTIARMLGNFRTLLEGIVADPNCRLSHLPILTEAERNQMLVEWNETRAEFPANLCIHELFGDQARRTPDAVAVVFEDQQLTYRELNEGAERVADALSALGVRPGARVGLCVKRSLEMMAGLLGILKAGGAYVPLDPTYPRERLAFMLEDSQAQVLVTQESLQARLQLAARSGAPCQLLCLDGLAATTSLRSATTAPQSQDLAYVIYTSGSTGKPKGVMVTHRNVVSFFAGMDRVLGTEPGVWLAVTSISFDISVLELFWTLTRGFKVIIHPEGERPSGPALAAVGQSADGRQHSVPEQIRRHRVTHLQCTPSLAGTLILEPESTDALRQLEKLLLGGEALPVALAGRLREILQGEFFNMYGPTETTVWSTTHRIHSPGSVIPIGRPIANTQICLLDRHLQPVPVGVPGELFIGGEGVTRGYLNRPELTAEKFIRDPFSSRPEARLYRTGDLVRYWRDGTIEFLGRLDHQVKIRGHRVELGEIESALREHDAVRECIIHVWENNPDDKRLVAYIVPADGARPEAADLRNFLKPRLPDHMLPAAFVPLEQLPLTPNGKVDRKALPQPNGVRLDGQGAYVAPGTDVEKVIAEIWRDLLRVEKVGVHDNFFDLGGHSLLVVQAQARLRDALGVDLPVVRLFQYPTIGALAKFLGERRDSASLTKAHDRARRQREAFARRRTREVIA